MKQYKKKPLFDSEFPRQQSLLMKCGAANYHMATLPTNIKKYSYDQMANTLTYNREHLNVVMTLEKAINTIPKYLIPILDFLIIKLTAQNTSGDLTTLYLEFNELAAYFGVSGKIPRARMREQVSNALDAIMSIMLKWDGAKKSDWYHGRIISSHRYTSTLKTIEINFDPYFVKYISQGYLMSLNPQLVLLAKSNPHIYRIGRRILHHMTMEKNIQRGVHDRLSLTTILKAVPEIPTEEEVIIKYQRHFKRMILDPVEKCLDELEGKIYQEWTWWKKRDTQLTQHELDNLTWESAKNYMIHFIPLQAS